MKTKPRIPEQPKLLAKQVIEYFYKNPKANTSKEMEEVFNVSHRRIRNKLENSLARRCARY